MYKVLILVGALGTAVGIIWSMIYIIRRKSIRNILIISIIFFAMLVLGAAINPESSGNDSSSEESDAYENCTTQETSPFLF